MGLPLISTMLTWHVSTLFSKRMHAVATEGCIYNMYGFIYLFVYFFLVMNFQRQYLMQPFLNNVTSWKYQSQQSEAVCVCVCVCKSLSKLEMKWKYNRYSARNPDKNSCKWEKNNLLRSFTLLFLNIQSGYTHYRRWYVTQTNAAPCR